MTPAEQIRVLLQRKKSQGITDWRVVWPWAVARIRWPHDRDERHEWKLTIQWAEPAYHSAFEGRLWVVDMGALIVYPVTL
jgi:hypothetical protein